MKLPRPWHDLIITSPCRADPNKFAEKYLPSFCHENLSEKGPSILYEGKYYALAPLKNHVGGICSLNTCKKVRTKTC